MKLPTPKSFMGVSTDEAFERFLKRDKEDDDIRKGEAKAEKKQEKVKQNKSQVDVPNYGISHSIVDLVNPLIEQAFGKGWKGNYEFADLGGITEGPSGLKETDRLVMIGKKRMLGFICYSAGTLGNTYSPVMSDGSMINVFPKYEEQAKKYAKLYKEKTGNDVSIVLDDKIGY